MERKGSRDNTKQWKQERKVSDRMKKTPPKKIMPSKVFIYVFALAALGGGGYLIYDRLRRKKLQQSYDAGGSASDTILINNYIPATSSLANKSAKGGDSFPLKHGSRGTRVTALQQGLARIIGMAAMNANGGIDGQFGLGTANALKLAGYGEIVDEATFNKITGGAVAQIVFNPSDIALRLYRAAQGKDVGLVLAILKEIRTVSEYSAVNEYYKRQALVSKTIVTDLLNYAFVDNESAKDQIKSQLLRMGLKVDSVGTWSLQGIRLYKDLITLRETIVTDSRNNRIPVNRNTILGDEIKIENGLTWFRSVDDSVLSVPTQDVRYT
jgi:hypothetical protein